MHSDHSQSSESVRWSQEDVRLSSPALNNPLQHNSSAAVSSSSSSSLNSLNNIVSLGNLNSCDVSTITSGIQLKGDWPLPPLRRRPVTSASLEQARRISRSLSFLLGEPDLETLAEEPPSPHNGPSHMLPPLSPHMPPLLTRTVTSPHFSGQAHYSVYSLHLEASPVFFLLKD